MLAMFFSVWIRIKLRIYLNVTGRAQGDSFCFSFYLNRVFLGGFSDAGEG